MSRESELSKRIYMLTEQITSKNYTHENSSQESTIMEKNSRKRPIAKNTDDNLIQFTTKVSRDGLDSDVKDATTFASISSGDDHPGQSKTKQLQYSTQSASSDPPVEENVSSSKKSVSASNSKHMNEKASGNVYNLKKMKKISRSENDTTDITRPTISTTDSRTYLRTNLIRTGLNPMPHEVMAKETSVIYDTRKGTSDIYMPQSDGIESSFSTSISRDPKPKKVKGSEQLQRSGLLAAKVSLSPQLTSQRIITDATPELTPTIKDVMNAGPSPHVQSKSFADLSTTKISAFEITEPPTLPSTHVNPDSNGSDGIDFDLNQDTKLLTAGDGEYVNFANTVVVKQKSGDYEKAKSENEELEKIEIYEIENNELPNDETSESETHSNFTSNKQQDNSRPPLPSINLTDEEDISILRSETATSSAPLASVPSSLIKARKSTTEEDVSNNNNNTNNTAASGVPTSVLPKDITQLKIKEEKEDSINVHEDKRLSDGLGELPLDGHDETDMIGPLTTWNQSDSLSMRSCGSVSQSGKTKSLDDSVIQFTKEKIKKVVTIPTASNPVAENEYLVDTDSNDSFMSEFSEFASQLSQNIEDGIKLKEECLRFMATKVSSNTMWAIRKELKRLKKDKDYFKFSKLSPLAAGLMYDIFCQSLH